MYDKASEDVFRIEALEVDEWQEEKGGIYDRYFIETCCDMRWQFLFSHGSFCSKN